MPGALASVSIRILTKSELPSWCLCSQDNLDHEETVTHNTPGDDQCFANTAGYEGSTHGWEVI